MFSVEKRGDRTEWSELDQWISLAVYAFPVVADSTEDLGHPKVPTVLGATIVAREHDGRAFDESEPRHVTAKATVEELDVPDPGFPLSRYCALAICGCGASSAVAPYRTHDGAIVRQRVSGGIAVDPSVVVTAAPLPQLIQHVLFSRHLHIMSRCYAVRPDCRSYVPMTCGQASMAVRPDCRPDQPVLR